MKRRVFLAGTLLGAAGLAALPTGASAASPKVNSLADLQKEIDRAAPGDRIVLADGTYTAPSGGIRVTGRNGTGNAPIEIVSESRGGAVLQGELGFVFRNSSFITVSGFAFRQSGTLEIPANSSDIRLTRNDFRFADVSGRDWVVVRGDNVKLDRNRFHDRKTEGIFVVLDGADAKTVAQNLHLFKNHFFGHSFAGDNGGEAVRLGDSARALLSAKAVVEYNLFEKCDGDPEAISVKTSENTVQYNTVRDSRGGIVLRHGNRSTVQGNYLLGGTEGIRVYGNDHLIVNNYLGDLKGRALVIGSGTARDHRPDEPAGDRRGNDACDRAVIVHNTLYGNPKSLSGEGRDFAPKDVVVADNLLVGGSGSLVSMGKTEGFTWQGNILWGSASDGNIPSGGFRRVDPLLRQESDGVYRLSAGSPAIGAATLKSRTVTEDIDGHPRGGSRDVGADQYATAPPVRRPLTATDVGPNA
ncbi:lyase precursor [Streptomyces eurocidicus]|uniref:Lyase n=1 Tax=Streptomyces eurocidicus TaxID=66423 RepID=A0A2N8NWQ6_STREU|nr:polysaccharide lyase 6 family protein [Streptomyces eurocidicus]MBB5118003.1 poly(beta-D-mannuronate) lyase [Streptomyces eurocidicus]MBF6053982.1 lyase precursor [Streptomyces eurocidicus]PNE33203.1 lyase precursor [Streptomyces eurocidicus]